MTESLREPLATVHAGAMQGIGMNSAAYSGMRFAVDPLWETVASRWLLQPTVRAVALRPWVPELRRANQLLGSEHRRVLDTLIRARAWMPDFITPTPLTADPSCEDQISRVRSTPVDLARRDIETTKAKLPLTALGQEMAQDPTPWIPRIADALQHWWELAVEPMWPRMRAVLEADIGYRSQILVTHGPRVTLESLHPTITVGEDTIVVGDAHVPTPIQGRPANGLTCIPSLGLAPNPTTNILPDSPTTLLYPCRAPGTLWERSASAQAHTLVPVLGSTRAMLLELTIAPHTTSRLAERASLSVAAVSMQMATLAEAGLVSRRREGRVVWHVVTDLGRSLLAANGIPVD